MSTTLPIKYIKDLETGDRFLPVTSPNAIIWPNGDDLEDRLSGKEDKVDIVSASGATLSAEVGKYYTLSNVGTLAITLPTIAAGTTKVQTVTFYIAAGSTPGVTFTSTHTIIYPTDYKIEANGLYEISAAWNGIGWIIGQLTLEIPT
jgi:hypothetical protein